MLVAEKYLKAFGEELSPKNVLRFIDFLTNSVQDEKVASDNPVATLMNGPDVFIVSFESFNPIRLKITKKYRGYKTEVTERNQNFFEIDETFLKSPIYKHIFLNQQSGNRKNVAAKKITGEYRTVSGTKLIVRGKDYFELEQEDDVEEVPLNSLENMVNYLTEVMQTESGIPEHQSTEKTQVASEKNKQVISLRKKNEQGESLVTKSDIELTEFERVLSELIHPFGKTIGSKIIFYVDLSSLKPFLTNEQFRLFIKEEFLTLKDKTSKWVGEFNQLDTIEEEVNRLFLLESIHFIRTKMFVSPDTKPSLNLNEESLMEFAPKSYLAPTDEKPILSSNRVLYFKEEFDLPKNAFVDFYALCLEKKNATLSKERIRIGTPFEIASKNRLTSFEKSIKIENTGTKNLDLNEKELGLLHPALSVYYRNHFLKNFSIFNQYKKAVKAADENWRTIDVPAYTIDEVNSTFDGTVFGILKNNEILTKFNLINRHEEIGRVIKKEIVPFIGEILIRIMERERKNVSDVFGDNLRQIPYMLYVFEKEDAHRNDETMKKTHLKELQEAIMKDISYEEIFNKQVEVFSDRQIFYALGLACSILKEKMTNTKNFEKQMLHATNTEAILRLFNEKSIYINELSESATWKVSYLMKKINESIDLTDTHRLTSAEKFLFVTGLFTKVFNGSKETNSTNENLNDNTTKGENE